MRAVAEIVVEVSFVPETYTVEVPLKSIFGETVSVSSEMVFVADCRGESEIVHVDSLPVNVMESVPVRPSEAVDEAEMVNVTVLVLVR